MPATNTTGATAPASSGSQPGSGTTAAQGAPSGVIEVTAADLARELGVDPAHLGSDTENAGEAEAPEAADTAGDAATTTASEAEAASGAAEGTETEPQEPGDEPPASEPEEGAESDTDKVPEKAQRAFEARIGELTAKRKEAETRATTAEQRIAALEQELAEAKAPRATSPADLATGVPGLDDLDTPEAVQAREQQVQNSKYWALQHLDGATVADGKGGEIEITAEQARAILANAERALAALPARRKFLEERAAHSTAARQVYPWLYDTANATAQAELKRIRRDLSAKRVADLPEFDLILGDAIVGQSVREGHYTLVPAAAAAAKPAPGAKPGSVSAPPTAPKVAPSPKAIAPTVSRPAAKAESPRATAAKSRFFKTGSLDDLAEALG